MPFVQGTALQHWSLPLQICPYCEQAGVPPLPPLAPPAPPLAPPAPPFEPPLLPPPAPDPPLPVPPVPPPPPGSPPHVPIVDPGEVMHKMPGQQSALTVHES